MRNQKVIIGAGVGLIVLVIAGFLMFSSGKKEAPVEPQIAETDENVAMISPEEIGLSLTATADNRRVVMEVENTEGISALDYELSYISKGDIPRGVIGHVDIKQEGKAVIQEITLGTCSDVCHYDEDVSDIKLILKVSKTDGSTAQVEQSLEL